MTAGFPTYGAVAVPGCEWVGDRADAANALFSVACGSSTISRTYVTPPRRRTFRDPPDLIASENSSEEIGTLLAEYNRLFA